MKICGIIAEYNPFHNGHLYHLSTTREITKCDYVICLMSGNFTQRGEPAIFNKWQRAKAAIACGVDLVLELPTYFSVSSAENFCHGAVKIFNALNIDDLSFGSEYNNLPLLYDISKTLAKEPQSYKDLLKAALSKGVSFPTARTHALCQLFNNKDVELALAGSNSILAIEYLKALIKMDSKISAHIVTRQGSDYSKKNMSENLSSATAIRKHLFIHGLDDKTKNNIPLESYDVFSSSILSGFIPTHYSAFFNNIIYAIRKSSLDDLRLISEVSEGLENRIKSAAFNAKSYDELVNKIKTKRITYTRVQRILNNILLDIKRTDYEKSKQMDIQNIKVLGYKKNSINLLSHFNQVSNINLFHSSVGLEQDFFVIKDIIATDIYSISQKAFEFYKSNQDFTTKTITD